MRQQLIDILAPLPRGFFVATSGGIDSSALVVAAKEAEKDPRVISFSFDDFDSDDFLRARRLAEHFNCPFESVRMPSDPSHILSSVRQLIRQYRLSKKARIECAFPFLYLARAIDGETLVTGLCADGHFGLSKKAMIHYRYPQAKFDQFRNEYFANPDAGGRQGIRKICNTYNVHLVNPYLHSSVFALLHGQSWDDLNKPRQKEAIRAAFPELDPLQLPRHTNLQLGDSKIAERLGETAMAAVPDSNSPVGAYNKIRKQR